MEQSSAKRRKLSLPDSVTATPLTANKRPVSQSSKVSSSGRASFMSPTKASLARFNPGLLPRARSSEPRKQNEKSPGVRTRASSAKIVEDTLNVNQGARLDNELPRTEGVKIGPEVADGGATPHSGISAAPRRRSRTPNPQPTISRLSQMQPAYRTRASNSVDTRTATQQGRHPDGNGREMATQGVGPLNGVTIDESSLVKLPPTPTRHGVPSGAARVESSEPSLPSTPSQLRLEAPQERPKGLLFGTPSKRAKNKKEKEQKPSSLRPEAPTKRSSAGRSQTSVLGPKVFLASLPKPAPSLERAELQGKIMLQTDVEHEVLKLGSNVLEGVLFSSWQEPSSTEDAGQRKRQKKLTEVSGKLLRLREEIEQLRMLVGGTTEMPSNDQAVHPRAEVPR